MKYLFTILCCCLSYLSFSQLEPNKGEVSENVPLMLQVEEVEPSELGPFVLDFDWMLDVKTEVINGIWYSPSVQFNYTTNSGVNFQFQTGALPTLNGYMIHKAQPSAGVSIGYRF